MKYRILVVDDEADNRKVLQQALSPQYSLIFAVNGEQALQQVQNKNLDMILLDIMMPGIDGYEVCRQLKANQQTKNIPIIFVTAKNDPEDETKGFNLGATDFINKPIHTKKLQVRIKAHLAHHTEETLKLREAYESTVNMLGKAGHHNDDCTGYHIERMTGYSALIAKAMGWPEENCRIMRLASPMHDIGKIGISDLILQKPGPLDAEEWETMKEHPQIGHNILLEGVGPSIEMGRLIALQHHEKWDGSGYPNNIVENGISEAARIVAVADVFDALTSQRPYKQAWPIDRAVTTIKKDAGSHFDPRVVKAFTSCLPGLLKVKQKYPTA